MNQFWPIFQENKSVWLLNTYRGVPVSYKAQIVMTAPDYLALEVHPHQAACIALEKHTYIKSKFLPAIVRAVPISVDVRQEEVVLTNFKEMPGRVEKRVQLRVQPREQITVDIVQAGVRVPGTLADISLNGAGVFSFVARIDQEASLKRGSEVVLELSLSAGKRPQAINGQISYIRQRKSSPQRRMGILLSPDSGAEKALQEYISRRSEQTLQELEETCQVLRKRKERKINL